MFRGGVLGGVDLGGCWQIWSMGGPWLKLAGTRLKPLGPQRKTLFVAASAWTGARTRFWFPVGTWPVVLVFRRCRIASAQPVTHRSRPATVPSFDAQTPVSSWAAVVPPWAERCLLLRLPFRACLRVCVCFRGSGLPVVGRKEGRTGERGGKSKIHPTRHQVVLVYRFPRERLSWVVMGQSEESALFEHSVSLRHHMASYN